MISKWAAAPALLIGLALHAPAARAQNAGTTVSGQVVSAEVRPQPVRRAIVTLTGGAIPSGLSAVTDDEGRFKFVDLEVGRYTLSATKPGYLTVAYGASRPGRPGTSLVLASGQQLDLRLVLPRGAVITGTVRDQFGQPSPGVQVTISSAALVNSEGGYRPVATFFTDDRGVYRAYGLMPDEYLVSATPRTVGNGELTALSLAEYDGRVRALEDRQTIDEAPGRVGYAPTFFPGTVVAANAGRVEVSAGEERGGIDIPLIPVRSAHLSGTLQGNGEIDPRRIRPSLTAVGPPQSGLFLPSLIGPGADGTFTFTNVTPGHYIMLARTGPGAMMSSVDGRSGSSLNTGVHSLFAVVELDVDGRDISGLVLALRPAMTISGRIAFDGAAKPPGKLTSIGVSLVRAQGTVATGFSLNSGSTRNAVVREDGTFELTGVMPGEYTIAAVMPAAWGWRLRSAIVGQTDVLDIPLVLDGSSGDVTGMVVTLTEARSELSGTLTSASGQPATEFTVLAFSANRAHWRPGARRIRTTRPGSDGEFSIMDLPSGEYVVAALTDFEPSDLAQASFLDRVLLAGVKVTILDGRRTRQDLRIAR